MAGRRSSGSVTSTRTEPLAARMNNWLLQPTWTMALVTSSVVSSATVSITTGSASTDSRAARTNRRAAAGVDTSPGSRVLASMTNTYRRADQR